MKGIVQDIDFLLSEEDRSVHQLVREAISPLHVTVSTKREAVPRYILVPNLTVAREYLSSEIKTDAEWETSTRTWVKAIEIDQLIVADN